MKTTDEVDSIMQTIPAEWRRRWCGGERGPCACMGCVQIGNRLVMANRKVHQCDPEHIDESRIPPDIYERYKVSKSEWESWLARQPL